jgi:hypothetical protein
MFKLNYCLRHQDLEFEVEREKLSSGREKRNNNNNVDSKSNNKVNGLDPDYVDEDDEDGVKKD